MKRFVAAFATTSAIVIGATSFGVLTTEAAEYKVENEDSLWGIANQYDMSVQQLIDLNELDSTVIHPGQTIQTSDEDETNEETYKVVKGDTLSDIALKYGVTVDELKDWNDLSSTVIVNGQELTIKNQVDSDETQVTDNTSKSETAQDVSSEENPPAPEQEGKTITVTATAYTAECDGCSGVTATGIDLANNPSKKVIAVDPNVIPLGAEVYVEGYGKAIAADVGGAIKDDKIDVHVPTKEDAASWGVQTVEVTVLD